MVRKFSWGLMTFLALGVGAYAASVLFSPSFRTPFVVNLFEISHLAIAVHLAGGTVAIIVGAIQLNSRLRKRFLNTHRWLGRLYVPAVTASGVAGLVLALNATGGPVAAFGIDFEAAYQTISWLCWVPNLIVVEWLILPRQSRRIPSAS